MTASVDTGCSPIYSYLCLVSSVGGRSPTFRTHVVNGDIQYFHMTKYMHYLLASYTETNFHYYLRARVEAVRE
jgi:hypothetical protein